MTTLIASAGGLGANRTTYIVAVAYDDGCNPIPNASLTMSVVVWYQGGTYKQYTSTVQTDAGGVYFSGWDWNNIPNAYLAFITFSYQGVQSNELTISPP